MEWFAVTVDKDSKRRNDPNDWSRESLFAAVFLLSIVFSSKSHDTIAVKQILINKAIGTDFFVDVAAC